METTREETTGQNRNITEGDITETGTQYHNIPCCDMLYTFYIFKPCYTVARNHSGRGLDSVSHW